MYPKLNSFISLSLSLRIQMCVYKIGTTLTACNNWSLEEQSLKQLMSGFFGIKGTDIPSGSISSALKASIHELIQRSTKEEQR